MFLMVPWLSEESDWEELSDEEVEDLRAIAESLGVTFPDPEMPDYYE